MARKVLITGATGDTGRATVKESLALRLKVRAMVHSMDERSAALEKLGTEVVVGDLLEINTSAQQWKVSMRLTFVGPSSLA
jgi:uncharacterized protein YbjT (DUF2867 family)